MEGIHDPRLQTLLRLVVEDVIETGEPVGSQRLVEHYRLEMSPATVRNWFAALEELGYVEQPHTSSGRLPTESGYRYYLDELMQEPLLRERQLDRLAATLASEEADLRRIAAAVADLAEDAAVFVHEAQTFSVGLAHLFAQPEFRDHERIVTIGSALDRMDEILTRMGSQTFDEPTALIGRECPFGREYGAVVVTARDGMILGLLGPLRMDYGRSFALLRRIQTLMNDSP